MNRGRRVPTIKDMRYMVSRFADIRLDGCAYVVRTRRGTLVGRAYNSRDLAKLLERWEAEARRRLRKLRARAEEDDKKARLDEAVWALPEPD